MPSEPNWSKKISNTTVCTWFYALAIVNLLFGLAGILLTLNLVLKGKSDNAYLFGYILGASVSVMNSWFFFLVCNRGLKV